MLQLLYYYDWTLHLYRKTDSWEYLKLVLLSGRRLSKLGYWVSDITLKKRDQIIHWRI